MKRNGLLCVAVVCSVVCCAALVGCRAWDEPAIAGGWSTVKTDDARVKAAADNAVTLQAKASGETLKLVAVEAASSQVVAGLNYRLTLRVTRNDKAATAAVVVWAKLDGSYQVTDWTWNK